MKWIQREVKLRPRRRGFHLITSEIMTSLECLDDIRIGLLNLFICHTSASLSLNENADPDVPKDLEMAFNEVVPETLPYIHTSEGPDDMPAHVKASMLGSAITIPIREGRLCLGTWQGIYLCEHRDHGGARKIIVTIHGE